MIHCPKFIRLESRWLFLIILLSVVTALHCCGQSTRQDSVVVSRLDLIRAVEKLDYCESVDAQYKQLQLLYNNCDELQAQSQKTILALNSYVQTKEEIEHTQDSIMLLRKQEIEAIAKNFKTQKKKTLTNSLAFGLSGGGAGILIGLLVGFLK